MFRTWAELQLGSYTNKIISCIESDYIWTRNKAEYSTIFSYSLLLFMCWKRKNVRIKNLIFSLQTNTWIDGFVFQRYFNNNCASMESNRCPRDRPKKWRLDYRQNKNRTGVIRKGRFRTKPIIIFNIYVEVLDTWRNSFSRRFKILKTRRRQVRRYNISWCLEIFGDAFSYNFTLFSQRPNYASVLVCICRYVCECVFFFCGVVRHKSPVEYVWLYTFYIYTY